MTHAAKRNAAMIAAAIAALIPSFSLAQTQQPAPPIHYSVDRNGVDMVTGQLHVVTSEVSIGPPGAGGLIYGRVAVEGGWRDLAIGGLNCDINNDCIISIGPRSEAFTRVIFMGAPIFTPVSNEGSTLTYASGVYTYLSSDGSAATLNPVAGSNPYSANVALLKTITAPGGLTLTYHYNTVGSDQILQSITNNLGYQMHYRYDAVSTTYADKIMGINMTEAYCAPLAVNCDHLTGWPSVSYAISSDGAGGLNEVATDQSLRQTLYHRDPFYTVDAIQLPGQSGYQIAVLRNGDLRVSQAEGSSGVWTYVYSTTGTLRGVTATGPSGQSIEVDTDLAVGQPYFVRVLSGVTVPRDHEYGYDLQGRLNYVKQPDGGFVSYTLDARGNSTQTTLTSNDTLSTITNYASYPCASGPVTCNRPATTTDGRGKVTNYTWNATHGGLEAVELPAPTVSGSDRPETRYTYGSFQASYLVSPTVVAPDPIPVTLPTAISTCSTGTDTGSPNCVGTQNEILTTIAYDTSGAATNLQPLSITTGAAAVEPRATTSFDYTEDGDLASVTDPAGNTTAYFYDNARQPIGVVGPDPDGGGALLNRAQKIEYSARGQAELIRVGTTTGQSSANFASLVTLQRQLIKYDDFGRPDEVRQQSAIGATRALQQVSYDASGRVLCSATRMNPGTFSSPPPSACSNSMTDPFYGPYGPDRIASTTYDTTDEPVTVTTGYGTATAQTEGVSYSVTGKPEYVVDGRGNTTRIGYDGFDRIAWMAYPDPSTGSPSPTDFALYGYDANSNRTSFTNRAGQAFVTTYDFLNRPSAITAPTGTPSSSFTYDNLGRPLQAAVPGLTTTMAWDGLGRQVTETGPTGTMTYGYDILGRRTSQTWPDSFAVSYTWDATNAMTTIVQSASPIMTYGYDNWGRRSTISRSNGISTTYAYDDVSRLTSLAHGGSTNLTLDFTYNPAGQIITRTMSNPAFSYTGPAGATNYTLDRLNRISSANSVGFSYDTNSNLTNDGTRTYAYDAANRLRSNGTSAATLSYDALGRLDTLVGTSGGRFVYDGVQAAALANPSTNAISNHFVRGPGVDEIVATYQTASPVFWMLDHQNSLVAQTNLSGTTTSTNAYDEFGVPRPGNAARFQYTGQMLMPDFGAYHYKARAYLPTTGRFLQPDPIGYAAGVNLYGYVGGDPINWGDPLGLDRLFENAQACIDAGGRPTGQIHEPTQYEICEFDSGFGGAWDRIFGGSGVGNWLGGGSSGGQANASINPLRIPKQYQCAALSAGANTSIVSNQLLLLGGGFVVTGGAAGLSPTGFGQAYATAAVPAGAALVGLGAIGQPVAAVFSAVGGDVRPLVNEGVGMFLGPAFGVREAFSEFALAQFGSATSNAVVSTAIPNVRTGCP